MYIMVATGQKNISEMPPFNERFVFWSACGCGSSSNTFRGGKTIRFELDCWLSPFKTRCDLVLFDTARANRVVAFIFDEHADIPHGLEAIGGWPCPVLRLSATDKALCQKARPPTTRFKSLRKRACPRCTRTALHARKWRAARAALKRWKSNCRFIYNT